MPNHLRVCLVINSLSYGGAENLLVDLIEETEDASFDVVHFGGDESLLSSLNSVGATVYSLNESFRFDPRAAFRLVRYLQKREFDVVHLHLPYAQTIGRLATKIGSDSVIISTQHNIPSRYHTVTRFTERITRPFDDATIAVSQGVERAFTGHAHQPNEPHDGWCTIYNGIDVNGFKEEVRTANSQPLREKYGIGPEDRVLLNVGRYAPVKSQGDLIRGFASSTIEDNHLLIVGHGPLKEELRTTVEELDIGESVHITGRVEQVEPYYALADVFVSSSIAEGMPVTLLEAMAASLPVVATDVPGVREVVVDGETGYLYPYGDTSEFVKRLKEVNSGNSVTEFGKAGLERAQEMFDISQMSDAHLQLYRELTSTPSRK